MQRTKEFYLDGKKYIATQYSATFGLKLLTRLAKIAGKSLGILMAQDMKEKVTPTLIAMLLEAVTGQIDDDGIVILANDVLTTTERIQDDGKHRKLIFDIDFAGEYGHLFKLLKEVLSFQYGDFFGEAAAIKEENKAAAEPIRARG